MTTPIIAKPKIEVLAALDNLKYPRKAPTDDDRKALYMDQVKPSAGIPIWNKDDFDKMGEEAKLILNCKQYKDLIKALQDGSKTYRVIDFITRDEDVKFVELILKAAFPPGSGEVFMPNGDYVSYDGLEAQSAMASSSPEAVSAEKKKLESVLLGRQQHYGINDFLGLEQDAMENFDDGASGMILVRLLNAMYVKAKTAVLMSTPPVANPESAVETWQKIVNKNPALLIGATNAIFKTLDEYTAHHKDVIKSLPDVLEKQEDPNTPAYEKKTFMSCVLSARVPFSMPVASGANIKEEKSELDIGVVLRSPLLDIEHSLSIIRGQQKLARYIKGREWAGSEEQRADKVAACATLIAAEENRISGIKDSIVDWVTDKRIDLPLLSGQRSGGFLSVAPASTMTEEEQQIVRTLKNVVDILKAFETGSLPTGFLAPCEKGFAKIPTEKAAKIDTAITDLIQQLELKKSNGTLSAATSQQYTSQITLLKKQKQEILAGQKYTKEEKPEEFVAFVWDTIKNYFMRQLDPTKGFMAQYNSLLPKIEKDPDKAGLATALKQFADIISKYPAPQDLIPMGKVEKFFKKNAGTVTAGVTMGDLSSKKAKPTDSVKSADLEKMMEIKTSILSRGSEARVIIVHNVDGASSPFVASEGAGVNVSGVSSADESANPDETKINFVESAALKQLVQAPVSKGKCVIFVTQKKISFPGMTCLHIDMSNFLTNGDTAGAIFDLSRKYFEREISARSGQKNVQLFIGLSDKTRILNTIKGHSYTLTTAILRDSFIDLIKNDEQMGATSAAVVINGNELAKFCRKTSNRLSAESFFGKGKALEIKEYNPMKASYYWAERDAQKETAYLSGQLQLDQMEKSLHSVWSSLQHFVKTLSNYKLAIAKFEARKFDIEKRLSKLDESSDEFQSLSEELPSILENLVTLNKQFEMAKLDRAGLGTTILILHGSPSAGKSAFAMALADLLEIDFGHLKLDLARKGLVGQTEAITEAVFQKIRQMNDVVLLADEFDEVLGIKKGSEGLGGPESSQMGTALKHLEDYGKFYAQRNVWLVLTTNYIHEIRPAIQSRALCIKVLPVSSKDGYQHVLSSIIEKIEHQLGGEEKASLAKQSRDIQDEYFKVYKDRWHKLMEMDKDHQIAGAFAEAYESRLSSPQGDTAEPFPQRFVDRWVKNYLYLTAKYDETKALREKWSAVRPEYVKNQKLYDLWSSVKNQKSIVVQSIHNNTYSISGKDDVLQEMAKEGAIAITAPGSFKFLPSVTKSLAAIEQYVQMNPGYCDTNAEGNAVPSAKPPALVGFEMSLDTAVQCAKLSNFSAKPIQGTEKQMDVKVVYGSDILAAQREQAYAKQDEADFAKGKMPTHTVAKPNSGNKTPTPQTPLKPVEDPSEHISPIDLSQLGDNPFGDEDKEAGSYYYNHLIKSGIIKGKA